MTRQLEESKADGGEVLSAGKPGTCEALEGISSHEKLGIF